MMINNHHHQRIQANRNVLMDNHGKAIQYAAGVFQAYRQDQNPQQDGVLEEIRR